MSSPKPWYKNWIVWIIILAILGYISKEEEYDSNEIATVDAAPGDEKSSEDSLLIVDMYNFLQSGEWKCVEIAKGSAPPMLGATFKFRKDSIIVENFGHRHELPYKIEFVLKDWTSEGVSAAYMDINGNKEMVASFDTDRNLLMLSWSNDAVKMKLIRNF